MISHGLRRSRTVHRYSSLLPEAWILTDNATSHSIRRSVRLADALNLPYQIKQTKPTNFIAQKLSNLRSWWGSQPTNSLQSVESTGGLPRLVMTDSQQCLPALHEIQQQTQNRTLTVYWGLPSGRLDKLDVLVLSRLDQMRLRALGPARANLDNAISTLLPFSGGKAIGSGEKPSGGVAVCVGKGSEPAGFGLKSTDIEILARGLQLISPQPQISLLLSHSIHPRVRHRILSNSTISQLENLAVMDFCQPTADQPLADPAQILGSASQVIATADDVDSVALAVSLRRPVYVSGQERTTGVLRNYYRLLDTQNLVRRFYPSGSPYGYMLSSEISGPPDPFSAIRDHQPWARYDTQGDLNSIVSFIQRKLR